MWGCLARDSEAKEVVRYLSVYESDLTALLRTNLRASYFSTGICNPFARSSRSFFRNSRAQRSSLTACMKRVREVPPA